MDKLTITNETGLSTLEILIAMTLIMISLSAVISVVFGSQALVMDSEFNSEASSKARELMEQEQAFARKDFRSVNPIAGFTDPLGPLFHKQVDVMTQSDFLTKLITASIFWTGYPNRPQHVSLSSLVTNFNHAVGGDACDSVLTGDWAHPIIQNAATDFGQLIGDTVNAYPITDMDAQHGKLYITVGNTTNQHDPNFFIFDITDPGNPYLIPNAKVDANPNAKNGGLNAVTIASGNARSVAYVASGFNANFTTCANSGGTNTSCGQLQVIDLTVTPPQVKYTLKASNASGFGGQAIGTSIFYHNGYVYLGLAKTNSGPEFHIIDVHDPFLPAEVGFWPASGSLGAAINAIFVKDGFVYFAHPTSAAYPEQLTVLNIADPANPVRVSGFFSNGGIGGNGKAIDLVGDTLYLGRTTSNIAGPPDAIPELFILNDADPNTIPGTPLVSAALATTGDSINEVFTRSDLIFALTNSSLRIWRTDAPSAISSYASLTLPGTGSSIESSFDCEGNTFFVSSNSALSRGSLCVITGGTS